MVSVVVRRNPNGPNTNPKRVIFILFSAAHSY